MNDENYLLTLDKIIPLYYEDVHMGCHASETKTPFTMIRPLGYGVPARYWDAVPSTSTGPFDERFYGNMNEG